jgi:outer membrane receptor for ferric coprogen and ferric-rhodotorulic acid
MLRLRFVLIGLMAVSFATTVAADPFARRAKAHRATSPASAAASSNDSYYVPYVTGAGGGKYPIMELPGSATVVSRKLMDDQQAITLGDALRNVSGVTVRGR